MLYWILATELTVAGCGAGAAVAVVEVETGVLVVVLVEVGAGGGAAGVHAWTSARPTFSVVGDTATTVNRSSLVSCGVGNCTVSGEPSLGRGGTATDVPSSNVSVAAVIWSARFGRSKSTTWSIVTGEGQLRTSHDPARPPTVAHSW